MVKYDFNLYEMTGIAPAEIVKEKGTAYINGEELSFESMLKSIDPKISWLIITDRCDYEGFYYAMGRDNQDRIYFVSMGYGSCEYCDLIYSLQSDGTVEDIERERQALARNIYRFESIPDFVEYLRENGWQKFWRDDYDQRAFIHELDKIFPVVDALED